MAGEGREGARLMLCLGGAGWTGEEQVWEKVLHLGTWGTSVERFWNEDFTDPPEPGIPGIVDHSNSVS